MKKIICLISSLIISAGLNAGTIEYDKNENAVMVAGFEESKPANMAAVLSADKENKWNITKYDEKSDTYRLNASLYIGDDKESGTYFQVGDKEHPKETVIVKGDVWIKPSKKSLKRNDGTYAIANRLTLGVENNPEVTAALKIDCSKKSEYGIFIGRRKYGTPTVVGGELYVFNSTITALTQDRNHMLRGAKKHKGMHTGWYANYIKLINAKISWIDGSVMYGIQAHNSTITGTTFENCGRVLQNGKQYAKDCTFKSCYIPVSEGGSLDAELINCSFEDNAYNFSLGGTMGIKILMINCDVKAQKKPMLIKKNSLAPAELLKRKVSVYPEYTELISLPVKVLNKEGQAIPKAVVAISCKENPKAVRNGLAITNENGLTLADPGKKAILIIKRKLKATDTAGQPEDLSYNYTMRVNAKGYKNKTVNLSNKDTISKPFVVTLEKK